MDKQATAPSNTLHVNRWTDLPDRLDPARYRFIKNGEVHEFTAHKKARQVIEGLMIRPIACASKCRISHYVSLFKRDNGIDIDMTMYRPKDGSPQGGGGFGVYTLQSKIERVSDYEMEGA